jgi:Carboxypeptidase regulatory-like domain
VNYGVVEGKDVLDDWIKTDARIIHGNSGGAAVNLAGKLIGIPTRVVNDSDGAKTYGSVGYLRPAHLVGAMISRYREMEAKAAADKANEKKNAVIAAAIPNTTNSQNSNVATKVNNLVTVRGTVKSIDGKPLAGVRVGLLHVGQEVAASSLITWGGTNAEGQFVLEKPVLPGKYNLRAKVVGYELYDLDLTVTADGKALMIELKSSQE